MLQRSRGCDIFSREGSAVHDLLTLFFIQGEGRLWGQRRCVAVYDSPDKGQRHRITLAIDPGSWQVEIRGRWKCTDIEEQQNEVFCF